MARSVAVLTTPAIVAADGQPTPAVRSFVLTKTEGEGVRLDSLRPMSRLIVRTARSSYRLLVLSPPPCISLQGGNYFHEPTEVLFRGAILGGTPLKAGWLLVGYRMALWSDNGHVVTSPVRSIEMELDSLHGPF